MYSEESDEMTYGYRKFWFEDEVRYVQNKFFIMGFVLGALITFGGCVVLGLYL